MGQRLSLFLVICAAGAVSGCAHTGPAVAPVAARPVSPACDSLARAIQSGAAHPPVHGPSARVLFVPPPRAPADLRGRDLVVSWQVAASGLAVLDSASVPSSSDAGYRRRLLQALAQYTFAPATAEGCPVPSAFSMRLHLS